MSKVDYVKAEAAKPAAGKHHCHWPSCNRVCAPAMWGCTQHWYMLPKTIRDRIWRTFRPGQEVSKTPSAEYIEVAREAEAFAREYEAKQQEGRLI